LPKDFGAGREGSKVDTEAVMATSFVIERTGGRGCYTVSVPAERKVVCVFSAAENAEDFLANQESAGDLVVRALEVEDFVPWLEAARSQGATHASVDQTPHRSEYLKSFPIDGMLFTIHMDRDRGG
jgi:hypothetical protein